MTKHYTAVITGAGSGIGRAFAEALGQRIYDLVLLDVDEAGLRGTAAALNRRNIEVSTIAADVTDAARLDGVLAPHVERIDLLINCAAILGPGHWTTQPSAEFERVLQVNLVGTANTIRAALPGLRAAGGHVVVLASTAAVHGWPQLAAYSAAKFGVVGFSEAIRAELAADGVGLTVVFPLLIDTPLLDRPGTPPILQSGRRLPPRLVVQKVLHAVSQKQRRVYVPGSVRLIAALHALAPSLLDWYGTRFGLPR